MIWVVIVVEAALMNWVDMGILIALQAINGFVGFYETIKAGNAVAALKASLKPRAQVRSGHTCGEGCGAQGGGRAGIRTVQHDRRPADLTVFWGKHVTTSARV